MVLVPGLAVPATAAGAPLKTVKTVQAVQTVQTAGDPDALLLVDGVRLCAVVDTTQPPGAIDEQQFLGVQERTLVIGVQAGPASGRQVESPATSQARRATRAAAMWSGWP